MCVITLKIISEEKSIKDKDLKKASVPHSSFLEFISHFSEVSKSNKAVLVSLYVLIGHMDYPVEILGQGFV